MVGDVGKTIYTTIYHLFMVIWGMIYYCFNHITCWYLRLDAGDAPSQLQQLREKILQAVPALPPELQKQLEVDLCGRMDWVGTGLNIDVNLYFRVFKVDGTHCKRVKYEIRWSRGLFLLKTLAAHDSRPSLKWKANFPASGSQFGCHVMPFESFKQIFYFLFQHVLNQWDS